MIASVLSRFRSEPGPGPLTTDEAFDALGNRRRRLVVDYLESAGACRINDLSRWVAAYEHDIGVEDLGYQQRQRVRIALHQTHLDRLDEADIVDWNKDRQIIRRGEAFDAAVDALRAIRRCTR